MSEAYDELATCNGVVLARRGDDLLLLRRSSGWWPTVGFVTALFVLIGGFNLSLTPLLISQEDPGALKAYFITLPLLAALVFGARFLLRRYRAAVATPLQDCPVQLRIDTAARQVFGPDGSLWGSLDELKIGWGLQLANSAPALVLKLPKGRLKVRGNVLGGWADDLRAALETEIGLS